MAGRPSEWIRAPCGKGRCTSPGCGSATIRSSTNHRGTEADATIARWRSCPDRQGRGPWPRSGPEHERGADEHEQGGAVLVWSAERDDDLGVPTRDPSVLGDAELAQRIEAGHLPPLEELLNRPGVDETRPAWQGAA